MKKTGACLSITVLLLLATYGGAPVVARANPRARADARQDGNTQEPIIRFVSNPESVPAFLTHDLDGNAVTPAKWKGKVTLLVFWATWCPPCRAEIPELIQIQKQYEGRAQVIGMSLDTEPAAYVKEFVQRAGINYPVVMTSGEIQRDFGGIPALPTTFVINQHGGIVQKHVGLHSYDLFDTEIRALLGMPVNAVVETFEDKGQIFLKNAANATELPGVDFTGLTPAQKRQALKRLNSEICTCGCQMTLAQCRINDTACPISQQLSAKIVREVREGAHESKREPSAANN